MHAQNDEAALGDVRQILLNETELTSGQMTLITPCSVAIDIIQDNEMHTALIEGIHVRSEYLVVGAGLSPAHRVNITVMIA